MPGDDDTLQALLRVHSMVVGSDLLEVSFDKKVLEELIEASLSFQEEQDKPKQKTGRRAAIAAQKARKRNAQT